MGKSINCGNSDKNESAINTSNNTVGSQRHYADGKTQSQKIINCIILFT